VASGTGDIGQGSPAIDSAAIAFLPVTMNGDGKTQIVQLKDNGGRLGMIVYAPQPDGSYQVAWRTDEVGGEGSPALAWLPVEMNGDGRTQIVQLWANDGGRLGMIVYAPQPDGSYQVAWGTGDIGQGSGALAWLPVDMNGDGKTQIVQLWANDGRLGMIVYAPIADGGYFVSFPTDDIGQGSTAIDSAAIAFLPVTMKGDDKTQIVQLKDNGGKLGMIVYAPNAPYSTFAVRDVRNLPRKTAHRLFHGDG
jgi:hypothetical protein